MARRVGLSVLVAVGMAAALGRSVSSAGPPEEVRVLRARLRAELEVAERTPASRLGLKRAIRYIDSARDAVPDGGPHGWVDDWIVAEAALFNFSGPRAGLERELRARVALAVAQLSAEERAALHDALVELLLDPMVLGTGDAREVERQLANAAAAPTDGAWRREVADGVTQPWLEAPARVERSEREIRVWLRDGSALVLPN
jgi:uncharacterized membrane protein YkvA (DUF1232 family)